jgi:hypothetical protein
MIAPGAYGESDWVGLRAGAFLLARNRLTRTAAERGFVLSGECVPGRRLITAGLLTGPQSPYEDSG